MEEKGQSGQSRREPLVRMLAQARESRLHAPCYATILQQVRRLSRVLADARARCPDDSGALADGGDGPFVRLVWEELGIWCYLAYEEADDDRFLFQAEKCFAAAGRDGRVCLAGGESGVYYALVLWEKIQWHRASHGDLALCIALMEACAKAGDSGYSATMWFRLGVLYEKGTGCEKDDRYARTCFAHARRCGLEVENHAQRQGIR